MAQLGSLIVNGAARVLNNIYGNLVGTVNGFTIGKSVPSNAVFTDTVTTATTSGSGNAVTAISAANGALTVTKGTTFLTSHQDISGKVSGPSSATNNAVAIFDGTGGKTIKNSGYTIGKSVPSDAVFTDTVTTATTSGSGNAVTAVSASNGALTVTKGTTFLTSHQTVKQDGITGATVNRFGTCSTAAATAAKTVSVTSGTFSLEAGAKVTVKFTYTNTASNPTLNVGSTGAKNIYRYGTTAAGTTEQASWRAGEVVDFVYDGSAWMMKNGGKVQVTSASNSAGGYTVTIS